MRPAISYLGPRMSTVTLKKIGCWPVSPSMNGVNATNLAAPKGALDNIVSLTCRETELAISLP